MVLTRAAESIGLQVTLIPTQTPTIRSRLRHRLRLRGRLRPYILTFADTPQQLRLLRVNCPKSKTVCHSWDGEMSAACTHKHKTHAHAHSQWYQQIRRSPIEKTKVFAARRKPVGPYGLSPLQGTINRLLTCFSVPLVWVRIYLVLGCAMALVGTYLINQFQTFIIS